MNCKPGDLAFVVGSGFPSNLGAIVRVVCAAPAPFEWECEPTRPMAGFEGAGIVCINMKNVDVKDSDLRPIRDNDGEDETLTWAGKPQSIKSPEAA